MSIAEIGQSHPDAHAGPSTDWRRSVRIGYAIVIGAFGSFALWASLARLDGAAIANGVVASESYRRTVQHLEGGIVQDILVRDGDRVKAGQVLLKLDPTRVTAQSDLFGNQLAIFGAQEARLLAEFEGKSSFEFPPDVMARQTDAAVRPVIEDQKRLFESRRRALSGNVQIAEAQIEQARREIEQITSETETARATLEQVDAELAQLRPLFRRQLVPTTRIAPVERERLRLAGTISTGTIQAAKLRERLSEAELRRQQVLQEHREETSGQLADVRKQLNDTRQQILLSADSQRRTDIRAPIDGTVQQLRIFTSGGVVRPGEPILDVVPANDLLVVRAKVLPNDVDRVSEGMSAEVKFPAFHYVGTQVMRGEIRALSRDRIMDDGVKDPYFAAEVVVDRSTIPDSISRRLSAGMVADVVIPTGERTVMNYLLRPILERWASGMRER
ncbi:MAG: HlyD family type I secretion periplasmic adaptor subunit [Rhizobiales bacterium]|nr:HlyD family type I secretion periplasmic adaptor subunit [Hyphomicrobiales bacterium]